MTLKMRSRSPKSNHFFPLSYWCICASLVKFQPLVQEIVCTYTFFYQNLSFKVPVWPCKWDQGHQNLITSFPHPNDVAVLVWSNSIYWFMRQSAHKARFLSLYNVVTLKMRSRSPKSNHFFPLCAHKLFSIKIWVSRHQCDLENEIKVTKI